MIHTWSRGPANQAVPEDILVHLAPVIRRHPWWRSRTLLTLLLLDRNGVAPGSAVLDAGCGWGVTLDALERHGFRATGLDISRRSLEGLDRPGRALIEADLVEPLPAEAGTYDAVVALDVIEHIDDDRKAVANLCRLTKPNGVAIVSVPALPELFAEFDRIQGHRRRYVPETLRQAFAGSGFHIERLLWSGRWLVPVIRLQRSRQRRDGTMTPLQIYAQYVKLPRWPLSTAMRVGFMIDRHRALRGRLKRGTSLIAVARRAR